MGKFLLLLALALVAYLFWKKMQATHRLDGSSPPFKLPLKRPLSAAQQTLFVRLQTALPSTMIMVQPALSQLISAESMHPEWSTIMVDFAICRKDSSPLGIVFLDSDQANNLEPWVTQTGLKSAFFKSSSLPNEQEIRDAFGFL
jgi:hypothetical protein